jgi:hypothetical protein
MMTKAMSSRRTFLACLPALAVGAASAGARNVADGADSAKTIDEVKRSLVFPAEWTEGEFEGRRLLFALSELPSDGASYIDLHGWMYNESAREWRRFLSIKTRHLGQAKLLLDGRAGAVAVRGAANNEFNGTEVLRFDLRATSSDATWRS